jgi:hypothetical protein
MKTFLTVILILTGIGVLGFLSFLVFFIPFSVRSARLLPKTGRTTVDGVTTMDDAAAACRASGYSGLELAAFAQRLVARKMEYSRRNPWDSWERGFERGMGYCIQQAMALLLIYRRLGLDAWPVQAFRCRFPAGVAAGAEEPACISGHMWLRIRIDGAVYDVCPGSAANRPNSLHFEILSPVRGVSMWTIPFLHVMCAAENVRRDWKNLFPGSKI